MTLSHSLSYLLYTDDLHRVKPLTPDAMVGMQQVQEPRHFLCAAAAAPNQTSTQIQVNAGKELYFLKDIYILKQQLSTFVTSAGVHSTQPSQLHFKSTLDFELNSP